MYYTKCLKCNDDCFFIVITSSWRRTKLFKFVLMIREGRIECLIHIYQSSIVGVDILIV